ncbi:hypothetical protein AC579_9607 [Pseudocercospora musae]|uniref:JmjC domain-containing protein n=1 Tax=Pseudocercospora musae TaxID=113226 RepID=A0A139ITB6_9PEZI|nr:hypothetical protein AC579_9607 [Pseudocercospora musae]
MVKTRGILAKEAAEQATAAAAPAAPTVPTSAATSTAAGGSNSSASSPSPGAGVNKKRSAAGPAKEPASKRKKTTHPPQDESADEAAPDAEATEAVVGPGEADADDRLLHDSSTEGALPVTTGKRTRAEVDDEGTHGQSSPKKARTASSVQVSSAKVTASGASVQEEPAETHEEAAEDRPEANASDRRDDGAGLPTGEAEDESPDAKFLREAIDEISKLKYKKRSQHSENVRIIKPFLRSMKQPPREAVQLSVDFEKLDDDKAPAAYVLTADDARSFLAGDRVVGAPLFVAGGAKKIFDNGDSRRPFEQVLNDWFLDSEEVYAVNDPEGLDTGERSIQWMKAHFLTNNGYVQYPWNFADILNPMDLMATPDFLDSTNCRLLRDFDRALSFGIAPLDICLEDCENDKSDVDTCCNRHAMTLAQLTTLQNALALWRGTLMLADAGAITLSHWDKILFGTWISCYEGEIGFAWLSHPDQKVIESFLKNSSKVEGTWLYKVIRPGESLYMPPGTIHTVFRRPQGTQTLGMAGHILRRSTDQESWLNFLHQELQKDLRLKRDFANDYEMYVVPPLMERLGHLIEVAKKDGTVDRFGGQDKVDRAEKLMEEVDNDIVKMRKAVAAARAPAASGKGSKHKGPRTAAAKQAPPKKTTTAKGKASTDTGVKKSAAKRVVTKGKKGSATPAKGKKTGK